MMKLSSASLTTPFPPPPPSSTAGVVVVTPGERLGSTSSHLSGAGTHIVDSSIFASITGLVHSLPPLTPTSLPLLSVSSFHPSPPLPQPGDLVLARVLRINPRYVSLSILCIHSHLTVDPFPAILRQRDIRSFDVDGADVGKSYRPGDVVKAQVLSLGDARSYFLTTAADGLGVVEAVSVAGGRMKAISWERMECDITGMKEYRKVAKPPEASSPPSQPPINTPAIAQS